MSLKPKVPWNFEVPVMEKMVLFVGGVVDGTYHLVDIDLPFITMRKFEESPIHYSLADPSYISDSVRMFTDLYERHEMRIEQSSIFIYVERSMTMLEAILNITHYYGGKQELRTALTRQR